MTPNPYNEDHLVEQPALVLLAELGWQTACGLEETFAPEGGSLGRRDRREVVLLPRLRAVLERLNPGQPPEAISAAIEELRRNRFAMGLMAANRQVVCLLKDGVLVSVPDLERGGQSKVRLRVGSSSRWINFCWRCSCRVRVLGLPSKCYGESCLRCLLVRRRHDQPWRRSNRPFHRRRDLGARLRRQHQGAGPGAIDADRRAHRHQGGHHEEGRPY
jgi:hypothetical protein